MRNFSKRLPSALLTGAVLLAIVLFLIFPARYAGAVREGVGLWALSVLPATLPMLFLMAIFTRRKLFSHAANAISPLSGKLFRVSGAGACAALISALSGYPVGARTVYDLSRAKLIPEEEKLRAACLSTTSGPAFLVGAVGSGMFHSAAAGWLLFASHLAGVYLVCFFVRLFAKNQTRSVKISAERPISLSELLSDSVLSVLCVGGAVAIFYAFGQMIADLCAPLPLPQPAVAVLRGLLEMTGGCSLLSAERSALSLALCAFLTTFGGVCVLVQQLAFLTQIRIPAGKFLAVKFAQGFAAALLCFGLALLCGF